MDPRIAAWMARDPDPETRAELQSLLDRGAEDALRHRFAQRLSFGTAGLRGLLGAGPARMNRLVVQETSAGLGNYLIAHVGDAARRGVVIGFDGRRNSRVFADDAARVFSSLGLRVHLFEREVPTPVAGFAVRQLGAAAGVVITASHNPPDYNGYKVYWENGAQIIAPHDAGIAAAIDRASTAPLPHTEPDKNSVDGVVTPLGRAMEQRYLTGVAALSMHPLVPEHTTVGIAYTPLHGVGARFAEAALAQAGFANVQTVAAQREPDGAFPTVRFPNPEEPGAMDAVIALAEHMGAALAFANDPDADRLAVALRLPNGTYHQFSGDEVGLLLGEARLRAAPPQAVMATTIVSSRLLGRIAQARGVDFFTTLTGFKWIANGALRRATAGQKLLFAYEEALGYTLGELVWDKDGISALVAFAELAAACAAAGETLEGRLEAMYRAHGLFVTGQRTVALTSEAGLGMGTKLRRATPTHLAGRSIVDYADLLGGAPTQLFGACEPDPLPRADVLVYQLHDDARVIVRPSGTEPKIKCYYEVHVPVAPEEPFARCRQRADDELRQLMDMHQRELAAL